MSTPPNPSTGTPTGAPPSPSGQQFWTWLRELGVTRSSDRWIGGVAGGVAARWGYDPLVVRGLFAASMLLGGVGFLLYGLAWALLPEPDGRIHAEQALRGHGDSALVGIVLLLIAGFDPANWIGAPWSGGGVWDGLKGAGWIVIAVLVYYYYRQHRGGRSSKSSQATANNAASTASSGTAAPLWGSAGTAATAPAPTSDDLNAPFPIAGTSDRIDAHLPPLEPLPPLPPLTPLQPLEPLQPLSSRATTGSAPAPAAKPPLVRGPGSAMIAVVAALGILTIAGLLLANRTGAVAGGGWALTVGILVVLVGTAIVVTGLRGRRSGILSLFAIVAMISAPSAVANSQGWNWDWEGTQLVGDVQITPTARAEAAEGVKIGAGNAVVDLTDLPLTAETLTVPISVSAGQITVTVPAGADVQADVDLFAGELTWNVDGQNTTVSGRLSDPITYSTDSVTDGAEPQLVLDLSVGAGDITIKEAS